MWLLQLRIAAAQQLLSDVLFVLYNPPTPDGAARVASRRVALRSVASHALREASIDLSPRSQPPAPLAAVARGLAF